MRIGLAPTLALALAACSGAGRVGPEPLDDPPDLASFVGFHPDAQGCLFGDCAAGPYAKRVGDSVISGVIGASVVHVEWERGPCAGWSYRGAILDDLLDGPGVLVPPEHATYVQIAGQFQRGAPTGDADATVNLADGTTTHMHGPLALDPPTCAVMFPAPDQLVVDEVTTGGEVPTTTRFHGVVRIVDGLLTPWRGYLETDPTLRGYITFAGGQWTILDRAVCLAGDCIDGPGVEHLGGGRFELFVGDFAHGARHGRGTAYSFDDIGVHEYVLDHDADGEVETIVVRRPSYTITAHMVDGKLDGSPTLDGLTPLATPLSVQWEPTLGLTHFLTTSYPADIRTRAKVPATTDSSIATTVVVMADLPHRARTTDMVLAASGNERLTIAITRGPRTALIAVAVKTTVNQAWLPASQQLVVGTDLELLGDPFDDTARLHGTGQIAGKPVVFYDGVRIDPLGFKSVRDYARASAATRKARATKLARSAMTTRNRDDHIVLALRRIRTSAGTAMSLLATATDALAARGTTADEWERVIRAGHAAVEQADDAVIDAGIGVDEAHARLATTDPCFEPLATLGADLHDLDDRLRVLLRAFDAFEYTDDTERLAQIAAALAADVAALSTAPVVDHAEQLRAAADGAPPPTPATLPKPPPPPEGGGDATTASPPPR